MDPRQGVSRPIRVGGGLLPIRTHGTTLVVTRTARRLAPQKSTYVATPQPPYSSPPLVHFTAPLGTIILGRDASLLDSMEDVISTCELCMDASRRHLAAECWFEENLRMLLGLFTPSVEVKPTLVSKVHGCRGCQPKSFDEPLRRLIPPCNCSR